MNSQPDTFETELSTRMRGQIESVNLRLPPESVVDAVAGSAKATHFWLRPLPIAGVALGLAVTFVAISGVLSGSGSSVARATVGGVTYDVAVDATLSVQPDELSPYSDVAESDYAWAFSELKAYSLPGVDPLAMLVVPAVPGEGSGSSQYFILIGPADPYPAACRFFDPSVGVIPPECSDG